MDHTRLTWLSLYKQNIAIRPTLPYPPGIVNKNAIHIYCRLYGNEKLSIHNKKKEFPYHMSGNLTNKTLAICDYESSQHFFPI